MIRPEVVDNILYDIFKQFGNDHHYATLIDYITVLEAKAASYETPACSLSHKRACNK